MLGLARITKTNWLSWGYIITFALHCVARALFFSSWEKQAKGKKHKSIKACYALGGFILVEAFFIMISIFGLYDMGKRVSWARMYVLWEYYFWARGHSHF